MAAQRAFAVPGRRFSLSRRDLVFQQRGIFVNNIQYSQLLLDTVGWLHHAILSDYFPGSFSHSVGHEDAGAQLFLFPVFILLVAVIDSLTRPLTE